MKQDSNHGVVSGTFKRSNLFSRLKGNHFVGITGRLSLSAIIIVVVVGLAVVGSMHFLRKLVLSYTGNTTATSSQTPGNTASGGSSNPNTSLATKVPPDGAGGHSVNSNGGTGTTSNTTGTSTLPTGPVSIPPGNTGLRPSVYFGAFDPDGLSHFQQLVNKKASIYHNFYAWSRDGSTTPNNPFPTSFVDSTRARGTIPMITWNPYYSVNGDTKGFKLADISSGAYDSYITSWAQSAKAWGHPFFLRTMHEANGDWYPWSVQKNGDQAYIDAWRHIHDIFVQQGATNVTWVWCPNTLVHAKTDPNQLINFYPGDSYVDWVGMDGYNHDNWTSFSTTFSATYASLISFTNKPIMIAETATQTKAGYSRADWITDAISVQLPTNFPRIKAFVYFNAGNSVGQTLSTSDGSATAFANSIASPYFVTNNYQSFEGTAIPAAQ